MGISHSHYPGTAGTVTGKNRANRYDWGVRDGVGVPKHIFLAVSTIVSSNLADLDTQLTWKTPTPARGAKKSKFIQNRCTGRSENSNIRAVRVVQGKYRGRVLPVKN